MKKLRQLWMLAMVGVLTIGISSCDFNYLCEEATGTHVERAVDLGEITDIALNIGATVHVMQGSSEGVVIKGREDAINNLDLDVVTNLWEIDFIDGRCMRNHDLEIEITVQDLKSLKISGSGDIFANADTFQLSEELDLKITGSGNMHVLANAPSIESKITGSGDMFLTGNATDSEINITGSGKVRGFDLWTYNSKVTISGSGDAEVWVDGGTLDVRITGSGQVYYVGLPGSFFADVSGSGEVIDAN